MFEKLFEMIELVTEDILVSVKVYELLEMRFDMYQVLDVHSVKMRGLKESGLYVHVLGRFHLYKRECRRQ